jgi:hypothetical protein
VIDPVNKPRPVSPVLEVEVFETNRQCWIGRLTGEAEKQVGRVQIHVDVLQLTTSTYLQSMVVQ